MDVGGTGSGRARAGLRGLAALAGLLFAGAVAAGSPEVVGVEVEPAGGDQVRVSVTIRHGDTGWNHYANGWIVLDEADRVLGDRVLAHPHVDEQPFTRSLTITVPDGVTRIRVRPRDSVHGEGAFSDWVLVAR